MSFTNRSFLVYLIMAVESVNYDCTVRGYDLYKSVWEPKERQVLSCSQKKIIIWYVCYKDLFDRQEWKRANSWESATGMVSIPKIFARSWSNFYRKSNQPYWRVVLVQGGLEIPCEVKAEMIATEKNQHILAHYFDLVNINYIDILLKRK